MVGIYARQSIDKKDSLSIESQIDKCLALCSMNDWTDYEIYKDPGFSGKDINRPRFKQLIEDVSNGKIEYVVCYKLDRISRSMRDFVNIIADFEECGAKFISVSENIDTSSSAGRLLMTVIIAIAQMERENIIERVTDNYYFRCNKGYWGGGPAPYGYELIRIVDDGKAHTVLAVNEAEAQVVRKFYEWYLEPDGTVGQILNKANELKMLTRNGSLWTSRVVSDLLWKPLYAPNDMKIYNYFKTLNANIVTPVEKFDGNYAVNLYGKKDKKASKHKRCRGVEDSYFIVSKHSPIVDSDTWIKVQQKKGFVVQSPPRKGTGQNSIYTGLIKCTDCGCNVSIISGRGKVRYYVCSSLKNRGKGACSLPTFRQELFDESIFQDIKKHFTNNRIREKVRAMSSNVKQDTASSVKSNTILMEIARIDEEIGNLIAAIATGNNTVTKYLNERIEFLDRQKKELHKKIQDQEIQDYVDYGRFANITIEDIDYALESKEFNAMKNISNIFVKAIYVSPNREIRVEYYI